MRDTLAKQQPIQGNNNMPQYADNVFNAFANELSSHHKQLHIPVRSLNITTTINEKTGKTVATATPTNYDASYYLTSDGLPGSRPIVTVLRLTSKLLQPPQDNIVARIKRDHLLNFFAFVDNHTVPASSYRQILGNKLWCEIYRVQPCTFPTYNHKTNKMGKLTYFATACQKCYLILPVWLLTIDHAKPQDGGQADALLRVFRAAGLTDKPGFGRKNWQLQEKTAASVGVTPYAPAQNEQRGGVVERYTLNTHGILYYSLLMHFGLLEELANKSMHHLVNLRPMCGPCNSRLRNSNATICPS
jgi:hypothetical protein